VRQPSGASTVGSLNISLNVPALGTVSDTYTQDFDVTADVDSVVWRLTVNGTDAQGRTFSIAAPDIAVNPPVVQNPIPAGPTRFELWVGHLTRSISGASAAMSSSRIPCLISSGSTGAAFLRLASRTTSPCTAASSAAIPRVTRSRATRRSC
jgi:hypothetical protein